MKWMRFFGGKCEEETSVIQTIIDEIGEAE